MSEYRVGNVTPTDKTQSCRVDRHCSGVLRKVGRWLLTGPFSGPIQPCPRATPDPGRSDYHLTLEMSGERRGIPRIVRPAPPRRTPAPNGSYRSISSHRLRSKEFSRVVAAGGSGVVVEFHRHGRGQRHAASRVTEES